MKFGAIFFLAVAYVATGLDIIPMPNGVSGTGTTTGYWDCCKPSCAWVGNLNGTSKTKACRSCSIDGETTIDDNAMSGCNQDGTGVAYMCTDQQPKVYNDTVTLGFVAASFTAGADVSKCCSCLVLSFKDQIVGKKMVVQVTNTGSDLGKNNFDMAIPGAGVGLFNGCFSQWNAPVNGWGDRYGGVHTIQECDNLPQKLQGGCKWRFQWFQGAINPKVDFYEIKCPRELINVSGCQ